MYMIHLLISPSPSKLLRLPHASPSHVLNAAFLHLFHRWHLSQIPFLKNRKGKDSCPRKCKRCVGSTKGLKNEPVSCSQTREHWKEEKSRTRLITTLAQKGEQSKRCISNNKQAYMLSSTKTAVKVQLKFLLRQLTWTTCPQGQRENSQQN